ncbi:MAG: hypothetical protein MUO58_09585 [Anaerolineales bacterium]|nr:hypothetical protein [Anaerolineales bacterium]
MAARLLHDVSRIDIFFPALGFGICPSLRLYLAAVGGSNPIARPNRPLVVDYFGTGSHDSVCPGDFAAVRGAAFSKGISHHPKTIQKKDFRLRQVSAKIIGEGP